MTRISLHDLLLEEDTEKKEVENEKKKSKKTFTTLTLLIRFDGYKYNRYCSIPIEGAKKLTLKHFIRHVVSSPKLFVCFLFSIFLFCISMRGLDEPPVLWQMRGFSTQTRRTMTFSLGLTTNTKNLSRWQL